MKIAVEGCAHGELENIYDSIAMIEQRDRIKVDLLLCCGDFQSTRNEDDMHCMAIPQKYLSMCTFYKYYSGEKVAPILTLFIGGNHEASNYLQELAFGGWVAPNIYYLGNAGVFDVAGIRIGGISGIFKGHDYLRGRFELPPYTENTKRSVYHLRNVDVFRLKQVKQHIDIFLSHDWPKGIYNHGDTNQLLKKKPFFREEVNSNTLGSGPTSELLHQLKPSYWFAAHLHVKFAALVTHQAETDGEEEKETKFLALDKCLPRRQFLQIVDIPHDQSRPIELRYDAEWLSILFRTNHLTSVDHQYQYLPVASFSPGEADMNFVRQKFGNDLTVPCNFTQTVDAFDPSMGQRRGGGGRRVGACINPQTMTFCERLSIDDPMSLATGHTDMSLNSTPNQPDTTYQSFQSQDVTLDSSSMETTPKRLGLSLPLPVNQTMEVADAEDGEEVEKVEELKPKRFGLSLPLPVNQTMEVADAEDGEEVEKVEELKPKRFGLSLPLPVNQTMEVADAEDGEEVEKVEELKPKRFGLSLPLPVNQTMEVADAEDGEEVGKVEELKPKRFSLTLPPPVKEINGTENEVDTGKLKISGTLPLPQNEVDLNELDINNSESSRPVSGESGANETSKCSEEKDAIERSPVQDPGEIEKVAEVKAPLAKKFKRRNQEFYANADEF